MAVQGTFYGLPLATLQQLQTDFTSCLTAIAVAGQSYTIMGRQFNRANLPEVRDTLAEIQAAITRAQGTSVTKTFARFAN